MNHALTADKPIPPGSKGEANQKTNWAQQAKAKRYRQKHDGPYFDSLGSLYHFETFFQFGEHLFEEPKEDPNEGKQDVQFYKDADKESNENTISFLEEYVKRMKQPPPDLPPEKTQGYQPDSPDSEGGEPGGPDNEGA